jgi:hypothetical protein
MKKAHAYLFEHEVDLSKPKRTVNETIFTKRYDGEDRDILFGDLPPYLDPTDIITYYSDPGYFSENNSWDPFTEIRIQRPRLETDEEHKERLEKSAGYLENRKRDRYATFLLLKEEFEPSNETKNG